jgi:hypothetical protein
MTHEHIPDYQPHLFSWTGFTTPRSFCSNNSLEEEAIVEATYLLSCARKLGNLLIKASNIESRAAWQVATSILERVYRFRLLAGGPISCKFHSDRHLSTRPLIGAGPQKAARNWFNRNRVSSFQYQP